MADIAHPDVKAGQNENIQDNASRRAQLALAFVRLEEGDADSRLIELLFEPTAGETAQQLHDNLLGDNLPGPVIERLGEATRTK